MSARFATRSARSAVESSLELGTRAILLNVTTSEPRRILFLCSGNYYRSRFAELLFNHLAGARKLDFLADSAGLRLDCSTLNPGPMSRHTMAALAERGVPLPAVLRAPRDVQRADVADSFLTVAVKEAEHRPLVMQLFPELLDRVEFWHIDDVGDAQPSVAIPMIESQVRALVQRLATTR